MRRYTLYLQQGRPIEASRAEAQSLLAQADMRMRASCLSKRGQIAGYVLLHGRLISNLVIEREVTP